MNVIKFLKKLLCVISYILTPTILIFILLTWLAPSLTLSPIGNYLIVEDPLQNADAMFVLGGKPEERAREAAKIHKYAKKIYTTGGLIPQDISAVNLKFTEAQLTKLALIKYGVPFLKIKPIKKATSTYEEFQVIFNTAKENNLKTIIVVSTKFHTKRISKLREHFNKKYPNVRIIIHGAPAILYDESRWWESEYGMIFVFNEIAKSLYYELKYF